jgi:alkanesulfonate monooxygenase SsuD/methylene tetrahydromethanopterin reductase-like flavin-dependent oxidoreductase (luciferase family)
MGDGWHPSGIAAGTYRTGRQRIQELARSAGRDPGSLTWSARVEVSAGGAPTSDRAAAREGSVPGDDPDRMKAGIDAYQNAGVDHLVLVLSTGDVPTIRGLMETIARRVIPQFR